MARDTLPSPLEAALSKAPSFGLPESFQKSTEGRQQATFEPGNVPFQSDFNAASKKYGVPVNVLMALADQESSFNPTALGQPTKWGRAKGLMQYIDSTAAGMGINPYDPQQSIDAAARQLKQRLDNGYSVQEAISAHFGGDDRKQWGPKTRQYGIDVLNKAQKFFDGTQGQIKAPAQQQERDFAAEYPAAQSAMENMEQNGLRANAIETQNLLDKLNAEEPGRYRALTATEMAQVQQDQGLVDQANQLNADVKAITQPEQMSIPDQMQQAEQAQQRQQAQTQSITDRAAQMGSDVMSLLGSGVNIAAQDVRELVGKIPMVGKPIVDAADRFDRWANGKGSEELFKEWDQKAEKSFSHELAAARKKAWVVEPGDDLGNGKKATSYSFGPAWSDPRAYMSGMLESLPEMALTMGPTGRLAAMSYRGALARGLGREAAAKAAARTATVAGGLLEGGLGGAQASRETRKQINEMTPEQLKDSEALKSLMDSGKTFEQARAEIAESASSKAFVLAGVGTGIFGGMGDRALAKIITGGAGGRLKSALTGAIGEGVFEELPQSALQQVGQNYAMQEADPNTPLMRGVANQAAGGLAIGGLMGAGMGAAAPRARQDVAQPEAAPVEQPAAETVAETTTPEPVTPTVARDDSGLSDDAGPLERAVRGTADQPTAANGNLWAGEPGNAINIQAKGDPSTAMDVTIDRYENDGSVTVRDGTGTPYTVTPDDIDINLPEQGAAPVEDVPQETTEKDGTAVIDRMLEESQLAGKNPEDIAFDSETGEVLGDNPPSREMTTGQRKALSIITGELSDALTDRDVHNALINVGRKLTGSDRAELEDLSRRSKSEGWPEAQMIEDAVRAHAERPLADLAEEELRDRMRYIARQAKQSGWDSRLTKARRDVEKVLNAKIKQHETTEEPRQQPGSEVAATAQPDNAPAVSEGTAGTENAGRAVAGREPAYSDAVGLTEPGVGEDLSTQAAGAESNPALMGGDNKPKWFASHDKAQAFIDRRKLDGYSVVEVKPRRFEIHKTAGTPTNEGTKAPALPKAKKESPRVNRARKVVGIEGDTVSPSGDVGYATSGVKYKITGIDKNGTIHLTNQETGGGTTISVAEMESGRSRNVTWNKQPGTSVEREQTRADVMREMEQDDNADALERLNDAVQAGKISPADAQIITERAIVAAKSVRDRSVVGDYIDEARERITGVYEWSKPDYASTIEMAETGRRVRIDKAGPLDVSALGKPQQKAVEAVAKPAPAQQNEQQNTPDSRVEVYHGTLAESDIQKFVADDGFNTGLFGKGVNFTSDKAEAGRYASADPEVNLDFSGKVEAFAKAAGLEYPEARKALASRKGKVYRARLQLDNPLHVGGDKPISATESQIRLAAAEADFNDGGRDTVLDRFVEKFMRAKTGKEQFDIAMQYRVPRIFRQLASVQNKDGLVIHPDVAPKSAGGFHYLALDPDKIEITGSEPVSAAGKGDPEAQNKSPVAEQAAQPKQDSESASKAFLFTTDALLPAAGRGMSLNGLREMVNNSDMSDANKARMLGAITTTRDTTTKNLMELAGSYQSELRTAPEPSKQNEQQNIPETSEAPTEKPAEYGASNKLVSQDRAAELRQRLKAKFSQLNSGIDPEILAIGTELAVFHIEAGVRKFADFAKTMAADLDLPVHRVRPYLRSWFNGARDMMEDSGVSIEGMDSPETVRAELAKIPAEAPQENAPAQQQAAASQPITSRPEARAAGAMDDMVSQFDNEVPNVSTPRTGLESDRPAARNAEPVNESTDVNGAAANGRSPAATGRRTDAEWGAGQRDQRVSDDGAAAGREPGNQRVHREDGQFGSSQGVSGSDVRTRSAGVSEAGLSTERARATAVAANAHAAGASDFNQRLKAQKTAPKETKWGDADSVRASLPMLLPAQQDDVVKVEQRHQKGNGIVITNGTGTGKTMSGLGVAKRFHNDGKTNILILVPSDKIATDWVKSSAWLDMPLKQLSGITDNGGSGPVITTYANLGQNNALAQREWDLVIPDESHRLMQNESGDVTEQLRMFRALTGHPDGFSSWMQARYADQYAKLSEAQLARDADATRGDKSPAAAKREQAYQDQLAAWNALYSTERAKWNEKWEKQQDMSKVVFLSATPFAYVMNTDYAEGFLFHHVPPADRFKDRNQGGYNSGNPRDSFYIQHFGYRMRYNKLTRPDAEVNTELMEQSFNQWLKDQGALIGRSLDVPFDYDRKFVLIDDAAGKKLDQALEFLQSGDNGQWRNIYTAVMDTFDHQRKMFLLESMKARAAVPIIKQHLALGRKVLVVHDYNQGGGFNPFSEALKDMDPALRPAARELFQRPIFRINFSGLDSALNTLLAAFPNALTFNGTVPKAKRRANADKFNDDLTGPNLLIAQSDAMREGVSVHDTSGKHQRVEINLGLPTQPTKAIQLEGRIYRTGQASDAIFRYMTTGTAWEASAFASKLAERASTAENLAMGPDSRALKQSFITAYQDAAAITASKNDGKGGKTADQRDSNTISEFEKAKSYYYAQQKNTKSRDQREGADYFATPEPVGLKMVEWAGVKPGDKVLEPSAGHGAIARFFPERTEVTMVEPSLNLSQRAALANGSARIVNQRFEDFNRTNKYDAIVMNPPYGMGGKTAYEHLEKATQHLREGGRIVALLPRGGMADRRLVDFLPQAEENGIHLVADIAMPTSTFERAGTKVNTRVLVLEKNTSEDYQAPETQRNDLSSAESVNELFDRIEDLDVPERVGRQQDGDNLPSFRMGEQQTPRDFAEQLKLQHPGLKLSLTGTGGVVTLQRIELPVESRNLGTGTDIMQQITSWADASGKTVALSPSSDFGGNKSRLNAFYKRFGFVENKGRNKDYAISETMYRDPQQQDLPVFTSNDRQASPADLSALNRMRGPQGQAIPADKFGELLRRIEFQNRTATTNQEKALATLRAAEISGVYSKEGAQLAQWLIRQYPHIANDLNIQLSRGGDNTPAGNYNVPDRMISLFSDFVRDGAPVHSTDANTATHEIMHHMERMMPRNVQQAIASEWTKALEARMQEYAAAGDVRREHLLGDLVAGMYGDTEGRDRAYQAFATGELPASDYQYASPSEYWAENGARIIAERKARGDAPKSWVDRAVEVMRNIIQKIRSILGAKADEPSAVMQALDSVLAGDGKFVNNQIINRTGDDMYGLVNQFGDYQAPDLQSMRSGMEPDPNIPTEAQDNAKLRTWWDRLKNLPADKMTDAMKHGLGLLPLRPLATELGKNIPSLTKYMSLKQAMDAMRNKWHAKTDGTAQKWLAYRVKHPIENVKLMDLMHDATIAQVDPSEAFEPMMTDRDRDALRTVAAGSEKELELVAKAAQDDRRFAAWGELSARFKDISPEGREIFKEVRDGYTEITNEYEKVLLGNMEKAINVRIKRAEREHRAAIQRITDEGLTGKEKDDAMAEADKTLRVAKTKTAWNRKARITQLRTQFEMNRLQGPYFPLARFGNLFVTVRDKESGRVESFSRFESAREQREFAQLMRQDPKYTVQVGALDDSMTTRKAVDANFVADVEDILADLPNAESVKDEVWQRYLESLPDFSIRKNRIHRTGRKGYNADALRAFGNQMFHSSHQLARLKYTFDMEEALDASREEAGKTKDPVRDGLVVNEMEKRHQYIMNPTGGSIATKLTSAAFLWFLAASPTTAIRNLAQTPMIGIPVMAAYDGGKNGVGRAINQFARASADLLRGKGNIGNSSRLTADEQKAIQAAYDIGIIDRTQAHDLASIGETGIDYSPLKTRLMAAASWAFHHTERINREVTVLMAYRMARAKGESHKDAIQAANDLTWKTHFDYQNNSRPRVMHNDMMKVALVFRNYSINMLYRLFRDIHQSVKGDSPAAKREARMQLAGITGMMMLGAGLTGTWGAGIVFALASAFMDDDKDPEAELKKNMVEALGPMMSGIILDGVPGYVTGTSQSESLGMRDLWFRSPNSELEGKNEFEYWQSQLLGATPSIASNIFRGYGLIKQGETYRGIETMMPKAFKDPMKAYRYATEGANNLKGDTIVEDVGYGDVIRQALGSTPAKLAEQYDINNAGYNLQQGILRKRQTLLNDYAKASDKGDEEKQDKLIDQIEAFNEKYPEQAITSKTISRSMKTRAENAELATGGMRYNRKLRDRILEEQAPRIYE